MPLPDPSRPLDAAEAAAAFALILDGKVEDAELATFLTTLADRGETITEVTAAATALRQRMVPLEAAPANAIDVCGTGGDGQHTLNISTAVALVVAACGVPVAKHGNRAASSRSGATDVLAALGVPELPHDRLGPCLQTLGITYLNAARHHPAMARVAAVRRALGRRTIFNLLGPLANPAGVRHQLTGVFAPSALPLMAGALHALGSSSALIVHGDGLDELALSAPSQAIRLSANSLASETISPDQAGLASAPRRALAGADPAHNAAALERLLDGEAGPYHDIVVLNAAAALTVADPTLPLARAATRATAALGSGDARRLLNAWKAFH
jgi:anthranilate phosphoribosyltransferase